MRVAASLTLSAGPVGLYRNVSVHGISVTEIQSYLSWHIFIALITYGYGLRTFLTDRVANESDRYDGLAASANHGSSPCLFHNRATHSRGAGLQHP